MNSNDRDKVFISYCHKDKKWLEKLQIFLKFLERNQIIITWNDRKIMPGKKWLEEIKIALSKTKVAVLLVTPTYLASDFISEYELPSLLSAAQTEGVKILWIAISASLYEQTELKNYQALNNPEKPLDTLTSAELNKQLVTISEQIVIAINSV